MATANPFASFPRKRSRQSGRLILLTCAAVGVASIIASSHSILSAASRVTQGEGVAIGGVVQDDKGSAVADAKVTLLSGDSSTSVRTLADGKYEFRNLRPGQYRITADATSFRKQTITVTVTRPDESVTAPAIKLSASSLHVAVVDANNSALSGVAVALYSAERGAPASPVARTTTDEGGDAYFGKLSPGAYQLSAVLRGYDEYRNEVFIAPGISTEFAAQLSVAPVIPVNEKAIVRYNVPNLPSKNIQAIFEDSGGWAWFGTDKGIARFNGADFESSSVSGSALEHLAGEDVRSIAEDSSGAILVATSRGLSRLSKRGVLLEKRIPGQEVRNVFCDSTGEIWISTPDGALKFDGSETVRFDQSNGLPSNDVRAIAEDKAGRIWVATRLGLATIEGTSVSAFHQRLAAGSNQSQSGNRDLGRPSPSSRQAQSNSTEGGSPADGEIRTLFVDSHGTLWFAGRENVYAYDGGQLLQVRSESLDFRGAEAVRAIAQDRLGRLWFALVGGAVVLYDQERGQWQRAGFIEHDRVGAIVTGREGITWFATDNGAVRADLYSFVGFNASRGLADNEVRSVVEIPAASNDPDRGKLWFLTNSGVSRIEAERFVPVERFRANTAVRAIAFDREGSYWLATEQGVLKLSGQTITLIGEGNGLASNNVRFVIVLSDGSTVVFATSKGANIFKEGHIQSVDPLSGYDVRHVFEDVDGRLWFATARGVVTIDPVTNAPDIIDSGRGLADNDARCIIRFMNQLLVATKAGVQAYRADRRGTLGFATFDSEPTSAMFIDRDGFLWLGTDDGQVKKFGSIGGYTVSTVYSGETYALTGNRINSISEDLRGEIWIGTDKGAVRHLPVRLAPPTQISFKPDGQGEPTSAPGPYTLAYGRQPLTFSFTAATMTGQVRYLYRLNPAGGDDAWTLLPVQPGARRDVTLFAIDAGEHAFQVIALNRDLYLAGSGAKNPAASLVIRVNPPFWTRWWFYGLGLTVIAVTLGLILVSRRLREPGYLVPKELRSYVPIEPNPYIVGNPIRTERMFFGREDDFRYVRTKLEGASQGVVIVFCGERRVGKSSILYQVLNGRLGNRFVPVFVDMQEMVISSDSEFFARVSRLIAEAVAAAPAQAQSPVETVGVADARVDASSASLTANATSVPSSRFQAAPEVPEFHGRNPYPVFLDFLDEVLSSISGRTLLILMDEYELLEARVDEGKLSPDLFTFLAGLMDNKERLALIFTGSRRLEERDKKYWRELLRRSLFRKVGFLSENDAIRLITDPVVGRVVYGRGAVGEVHRLTAGQPFYVQVTCQNIVDYLNERRQNWVTLSDLQNVISDIVDNPLPQMIYTWDGLSDDEKLVISLLGEQLRGGEAFATAKQLRASVRANDYPVNLSENTIRLTLEEMFRRELLDKDSTDGFRFKIDLLRLWIRRSHSIWQVVKEVRTL